MTRRAPQRDAAWHEAGHAIGHYFYPLTGATTRITIRKGDLDDETLGVHYSRHRIPAVVGRAIDMEAVRAEIVVLFCGPAAEMKIRGDEISGCDDDCDIAFDMFDRAVSDAETEAAIRWIPERELATRTPEDLVAEYGKPVAARQREMLEELFEEACALIGSKWEHVGALAKVVYRKKVVFGDEVRAIIERVEEDQR